jgi:hypothetical protein
MSLRGMKNPLKSQKSERDTLIGEFQIEASPDTNWKKNKHSSLFKVMRKSEDVRRVAASERL